MRALLFSLLLALQGCGGGGCLDCSEGGACACAGGAQCIQKERMSTNQSTAAPAVYLVYECEAKK